MVEMYTYLPYNQIDLVVEASDLPYLLNSHYYNFP